MHGYGVFFWFLYAFPVERLERLYIKIRRPTEDVLLGGGKGNKIQTIAELISLEQSRENQR